jgi:AcrR family transcriptional regulator
VSDDTSARFTRKGLAVREHIVDATAELMFEHGVEGTSLENVRSSAGVSGSQLAHYFADKRDLTRQVIAARRGDVRDFHTQRRLGALDSIEALQAWADACVADVDTVYRCGGCVYGSLAGELLEADDQIHDDLAAGYDEWIRDATTRRSTRGGRSAPSCGRTRHRPPGRRDADLRHRQPRTTTGGGQCRRRLRAVFRASAQT